jgi:hypothetical protein
MPNPVTGFIPECGFLLLYGCKTRYQTLREKHGLAISENRVVRGISVTKRDEVGRFWRKLRNEELQNFYSSPSIIRIIVKEDDMCKVCSMHGKTSEENRPLRRQIRKLEDNIKDNQAEIGSGGINRSDLAQGRDQWRALGNTVMNLRVP